MKFVNEIITRNNYKAIVEQKNDLPDLISFWIETYFQYEVTTSENSQKVQRRDLQLFLNFMIESEKKDDRVLWSLRLSQSFKEELKNNLTGKGKRRWGDRTINRILAHLKTFAKWIHKYKPFPLGQPMEKIKSLPLGSSLEIERAITQSERRRLLDAADLLLVVGGLSKNRRLAKKTKRKNYRAYRNRAIVYTLIETGMRRQAITKIDLHEIDFDKRTIQVEEKGGAQHKYHISREGIETIQDYIKEEREQDSENWKSPALFLKSFTNNYNDGRLAVWTINSLWNNVCEKAGVVGKTPHSARHAMGRHIIQKTGNVAAVQRQLGHKNAAYSMQYSRITSKEMQDVLDKR